ncbi:MAG: hypothetical protein ACRDJN_23705 [Chloroflexota bacterium]
MTDPVRLHPDNPSRLLWRGQARFLLGSTEHYGALVNAAFDYQRYLDTIAADGLSLTRAFAFYRELEESLDKQIGYANTLAPRPEHYLAPWARVPDAGSPGADGLPKFDLDTWDERYFARLRGFLAAAAARGVVVELVCFCNAYDEPRWRHLPLHPASNVHGVGAAMAAPRDFGSLADPSVVDHQRRLVQKLVAETNEFDNLYYEICNEPGYARDGEPQPEVVRDWQRTLIQTVREAERPLPKRHLVAVNPHLLLPVREPDTPGEGRIGLLDDGFYRHDPQVDLLNIHYLSHRRPREGLHHAYPGGARPRAPAYRFGQIAPFVALRAASGKPIGFDEDYSGVVGGQPLRPEQKRLEAWESLLGGCATYDHLDFTFTTDDPTGAASGHLPAGVSRERFDGRALRRQLAHVAAYASELDLATLRPDLLAVQQAPRNVGAVAARAVGPPGPTNVALVVYLADLRQVEADFGDTALAGALHLGGVPEAARYAVRALNPQSGRWTDLPDTSTGADGRLAVEVPAFREDLLLHLNRIE